MKRLKDVYRCVVCGGDMQVVKYNMAERKVYYHCDRCGYEETLTFEEAGIDDEEYAYFILREDVYKRQISHGRQETEAPL